jgi:hypothetical protein
MMPEMPPDGIAAQILVKMGEIGAQVAVIGEQLKAIPDHETRIRSLERFRFMLAGAVVLAAGLSSFAGYVLGHAAR